MKNVYKKILALHRVPINDAFHPSYFSVKVTAAPFEPILISIWLPHKKSWVTWNKENYFKLQEMISISLQCLYYCDLEIGESIVQRGEGGKCYVHSISSIKEQELENSVRQKLLEGNKNNSITDHTFGADIEGLLFHPKRKKYITASSLFQQNGRLGYDRAMIVKGYETKNHILELRPLPAKSGVELFANTLKEFNTLQKVAKKYQLQIIGGANPTENVFLGGHLHVGNQPISYPILRKLDAYLGIPMSITEKYPSLKRRTSYGRLGAVKKNKFQGFEYRTLASWIESIPSMEPVFLWFVFLLNYPKLLINNPLSHSLIEAYYSHDEKKLVNEVKHLKRKALSSLHRPSHKELANNFFHWVEERTSLNDKVKT